MLMKHLDHKQNLSREIITFKCFTNMFIDRSLISTSLNADYVSLKRDHLEFQREEFPITLQHGDVLQYEHDEFALMRTRRMNEVDRPSHDMEYKILFKPPSGGPT